MSSDFSRIIMNIDVIKTIIIWVYLAMMPRELYAFLNHFFSMLNPSNEGPSMTFSLRVKSATVTRAIPAFFSGIPANGTTHVWT